MARLQYELGREGADSGNEVVDSGTKRVDSGTERVDSGTEGMDSGTEKVDLGTEGVDSGGLVIAAVDVLLTVRTKVMRVVHIKYCDGRGWIQGLRGWIQGLTSPTEAKYQNTT
jgi:hypothetical protein